MKKMKYKIFLLNKLNSKHKKKLILNKLKQNKLNPKNCKVREYNKLSHKKFNNKKN